MSATEPSLRQSAGLPLAAAVSTGRWARLESRLQWASEWLNPLLVKECRQALKSRQFLLTFSLLLACAWIWSVVGIAMIGPSAYYAPAGPEMFYGYFCVLAFALLVVVPYGTFRSLAGECEDRTFELVSITTLGPRQIVTGKLGSAVAQMIVYLSAIAPCLAFTYLLRGIDLLSIAFTLGYLMAASFCFSAVALLLATVAREKHWQIILGVAIVISLLYFLALACMAAQEILGDRYLRPGEAEFWTVHAVGLSFYASSLALVCVAATAQLSFASANRSTPMRVAMLVQFLLWTGWMTVLCLRDGQQLKGRPDDIIERAVAYFVVAALYWYVAGAFMVCERPLLSPRVKRSLPQSFLGRVLFTWFNPGPCTGYLFAVANASTAAVIGLGVLYGLKFRGLFPDYSRMGSTFFLSIGPLTEFIVFGLSYLVLYLGSARLLASRLPVRWQGALGVLAGPSLQFFLLAVGGGAPVMLIVASGHEPGRNYPFSQLTNPFWTLAQIDSERHFPSTNFELAKLIVPAMAMAMLALNLRAAAREVAEVRIATPARLLEDDAASPAAPERNE